MATSGNLFVLTIIWCSIFLPQNVISQTYLYKQKDVNQYEIKNGKYRIVPTTTPPPSFMETFFPWTGTAYNSVRIPEEDAAILNSLTDPEPPSSSSSSSDGFMSWFGLGSSNDASSSQSNNSPPNYPPYSYPPPSYPPPPGYSPVDYPSPYYPPPNYPPSNYPPPPMYDYMSPMNMIGSASQVEPIVVPPPGSENQLGMPFIPPGPEPAPGPELGFLGPPPPPPMQQQMPPLPMQQQMPPPPMQQQMPPPPVQQMPPSAPSVPQVNPTFQFHQQVKDSIPIPSPSLPGFGPSMFSYPGGNLDFIKSTTEKPPSYLDVIANYFTFGKRSDLEGEELAKLGEPVMQARSMSGEDEYEAEEIEEDETAGLEPELKEASAGTEDKEPASPPAPSTDGKAFPCPKSGIWRWNGEVCIAVGPVPIWACRPNDLMVSGKIAICRNKIYFSPKVITNTIN